MPRNQETIRQWHVLRALAGARLGIGVDTLATEQGVTPRTIRRDFRALQEAGFPLYQEHRDAGLVWKIEPRALRGLDSSFDVDPYRIVYAEGGLYLSAYVPEYCEVRTFAVERIHRLALREEHFPEPQTPTALFPHSLGVHSGTPERVEIEFEARVAHRIAEREWHPSQKVRHQPDGSIRIEIHVCIDRPLRHWILGFGSQARVITPLTLAEDMLDELDAARTRYVPRLDLDGPHVAWDASSQRALPFGDGRRLDPTSKSCSSHAQNCAASCNADVR